MKPKKESTGRVKTSLTLSESLLDEAASILRRGDYMYDLVEQGLRLAIDARKRGINPVPISEQIAQSPIHSIGGSDIFGPISEDERDKVTKLLRILRSGRQDASQGIIWNLEWADSWLDRQEGGDGGSGNHASVKPKDQAPKESRGARKAQKLG